MPDTLAADPQTTVESFGSFRATREGSTPPKEPAQPKEEKQAASADPIEGSQPSAGSDPESQQGTKVDKRKAEIQKDIDAQVARREAARREADAEEARLTKLRGGTDGTPPGEAAKPAAAPAFDGTDEKDPEPKRPVQAEFKGTWDEWEQAKEAYLLEKAEWNFRKRERVSARERDVKESETKRQTAWQGDLDSFEKTAKSWAKENASDFDDLYQEIKKRPVLSAETTSVAVYGGEDGARLLYELMTHPDQLEEIEKMPRAIDRFNALYALKHKLATPASEPAIERPRSNAPPARTPLSGTGGGGSSSEPKNYLQFAKQRHA